MTEIKDMEFIEEGTIARKLRLVDGKLFEVARGSPEWNTGFHRLIRGVKTGKLCYAREVEKS